MKHIGSGIRRIRNLCKDYGIAEPRIEVSEHWFTVIFPRVKSLDSSGQAAIPSETESDQAHGAAQEAQGAVQEAQVLAAQLQTWEYSLLKACARQEATGVELLDAAGYSSRTGNFKRGLEKLLTLELLEMTIPEKPRSSKQRYRLTTKGRALLEFLEQPR